MKELKKIKKRLIAKQQILLKKTQQLQEQMDRLEKLWKTPVDYQELLVLSKKEDLYPFNW